MALLRVLKRWYAPALEWSLRRPLTVEAVQLASVVPSALLGVRLGGDFMPERHQYFQP